MTNSVEILVHISAPGTAKADANYRAHADAYFEFETVSRIRIFPDPPPCSETGTDEIVDTPYNACNTSPQDGSNTHRIAELGGRNEKESHYTSIPNFLPSGKSTTSLPSTWGPSFGETTCGLLDLSGATSQRSFSQNDAGARAQNPFLNTPSNSSRALGPEPPKHFQTRGPSSSQVTETPPSEVPESQPSFGASWDVERDNSPPRRSVHDVQIIGISSLEVQSSQSKRRRLSGSPACIPSSIPDALTAISSIISESELPPASQANRQPQPQQRYRPSDKPVRDFHPMPLEINPPRPAPSSTAQFTTHITPTLQMLADKLNLSKIFNPLRQTRPLRTLERGYWLLDLTISDSIASPSNDKNKNKNKNKNTKIDSSLDQRSSSTGLTSNNIWTSKLFFDFWDFLSNFIARDGRAGWGVWCICESNKSTTPSGSICSSSHSYSVIDLTSPEHIHSSAGETQPSQLDANLAQQQVTVKIYTWGEIAPHVYLLLYLASDRNVRNVPGVQWRDGADQPVILMD
ncbi:hypothetical protein ACJ72_07041 [Emergomyces africanus]|uniref:Uncharacterized protein n=1 Tax=Emergomyces africanus TaxID=1955775 RepID=A0A1B7NPA9_9EURO|nr:hypothetical protein ACJ72_07041 [Emergomyces africanus]